MSITVEYEWPSLPKFGEERSRVEVPSMSERGKKYVVDLFHYTCTCPDFTEKRNAYARYDLRRACKHIRSQVEQEYPFLFQRRLTFNCGEQEVRAVQMFSHNWIDVYTTKRTGARSRRFGYSLVEDRWTYGDAPKNAAQIATTILQSFAPFETSLGSRYSDGNNAASQVSFAQRFGRWLGNLLSSWLE